MAEVDDVSELPMPPPVDEFASVRVQNLVEEDVIGLLAHHKHANVALRTTAHTDFNVSAAKTLPSWAVSLDASRPWLCFWIVHSLALLGQLDGVANLHDRIIGFLARCRHPNGGFGGGPGQLPHLAPTYAAVMALVEIGTEKAYEVIDRKSLVSFLLSLKQKSGAFIMHDQDVRATYCALAVGAMCCLDAISFKELTDGVGAWVKRCQTYEGAFGGEPGNEAHGGQDCWIRIRRPSGLTLLRSLRYAFCALAALLLMGELDTPLAKRVLRWASRRQLSIEGGFQGRTNKLVDSCYSYWVGGMFPLVDLVLMPQDGGVRDWLFESEALRRYILVCCQAKLGGIKDKPDKIPDLYHTAYALSGLAFTEHRPVPANAPSMLCANNAIFNVTEAKAMKALAYFSAHPVR